MIKFPRYKGQWHEKKIEKISDAIKSTFIAIILYFWTTTATLYTTAKFVYELLLEVAKEIKEKKQNKNEEEKK